MFEVSFFDINGKVVFHRFDDYETAAMYFHDICLLGFDRPRLLSVGEGSK